jgi:hypothetical protein
MTRSQWRSTGMGKKLQKRHSVRGTPVIETSVGRGKDETGHEFTQCDECGSVWMTYIDSGAGGHGRFHRRLTKGFY